MMILCLVISQFDSWAVCMCVKTCSFVWVMWSTWHHDKTVELCNVWAKTWYQLSAETSVVSVMERLIMERQKFTSSCDLWHKLGLYSRDRQTMACVFLCFCPLAQRGPLIWELKTYVYSAIFVVLRGYHSLERPLLHPQGMCTVEQTAVYCFNPPTPTRGR